MKARPRLKAAVIAAFLSAVGARAAEPALPSRLAEFVRPFSVDTLGFASPSLRVEDLGPGLFRVRLSFDLETPVRQDDWKITVRPAFAPTFHWSPHLTPTDAFVIDQHAFRSPALVAASKEKVLVLVPDLDLLLRPQAARWYMDLDAPANALVLGMSETKVEPGLFFSRAPGASYPAGRHEVGFYLFVSSDPADIRDPWRKPLAFLWEHWGRKLFESGSPLAPDLSPYVRRTYDWAFGSWAGAVWQEFELEGEAPRRARLHRQPDPEPELSRARSTSGSSARSGTRPGSARSARPRACSATPEGRGTRASGPKPCWPRSSLWPRR